MRSLPYAKAVIYLVSLIYLLPCAASVQIPIIQVDTRDKSAFDTGKALGNAIKQHFPNIEQLYDAYLSSILSQDKFDRWSEQRVRVIMSALDSDYRDEVSGITSVWQISSHDQLGDGYLSLNEYWFFLLAPDIGISVSGSGFGVWGDGSRSGYPIVGRNLDWSANDSLRSLQAITVYRGEDHGLVNIGFAGFIGVMSGFNQAGLFLAHINSPMLNNLPDEYASGSAVFDIRKALENTTRISKAAEILADKQYAVSHSVLLADNYDVRVLEQPPGQASAMRRDTSTYRMDKRWDNHAQIAVVNCFALQSSPDNCYDMRDNFRWDRYRNLATFSDHHQAKPSDVIRVMFDRMHHAQAIFNPRTMQAMVFEPKTRNLHLYVVPISGIHETDPRMLQIGGLLSGITDDAFDWLSTLNLVIFLALAILAATLIYGEFIRKKA